MIKMRSYQECEEYILNIPKFHPVSAGGKHTMDQLRDLLDRCGRPGMDKKIIHVAGTNGKGSVCAYLRSILDRSGMKIGMFTSPHLVSMRERIVVGDRSVSEAEFVAAFAEVKRLADHYWHPNFFEFIFIMAMIHFDRAACDYIILETGLGGRLDATNVIAGPRVCVITRIVFDHMDYLGEGLSDIAGEKAGIMKEGVPVVVWDTADEAAERLKDEAKRKGCPLLPVDAGQITLNAINNKEEIEGIMFGVNDNGEKNGTIGNKSIDFSFNSRYDRYVGLKLGTSALYQTENAALAVQAAELLREWQGEHRITAETIRSGLAGVVWPGRMEEFCPGIILDGAHNEDGIAAFLTSVKADGCRGRRFLLYGGVKDKRYKRHIELLVGSGLFAEAAAAPLANERSLSYEDLQAVLLDRLDDIALPWSVFRDIPAGLRFLIDKKGVKDLIYIAGSLYLVGQIKCGEE